MTTISKLDSALQYASLGWKVFPVRPGGKEPCTPHGVDDATTDEALIRRWFGNGLPNIGIASGLGSIDVLDIDVHPTGNGYPALKILAKAGLVRDALAIVRTPSGGAHLWFKGTDQRNGRLRDHHIDFRSQGGYVLAPLSIVGGKPYEFTEPVTETIDSRNSRDSVNGRCDWSAIRELLCPPKPLSATYSGSVDITRLAGWVARLHPGERNCGTYWAMRRAVESGLDVEPLIVAAVSTGLSERAVRETASSALRGAR